MDFSRIRIPNEVFSAIQESLNEFLGNLSNYLKAFLTKTIDFVTSIPTIGIYVVVTLISLYFICTDKIYMLDQLEHHLPQLWVKKIGIHLRELIKVLGNYLKAEATLVIISFIISLIGLYIIKIMGLNVEYPLIVALLIGFVDALPILGSGAVMVPWAIFSAFNGDINLSIAIFVLWAIMSIVRQFIEPKIISNKIGIHPIFTLIAMYTGFKFIGVLGMLVGPIILIILKNIFATLIDKGIMKFIFDRK